MAPLPGFGRGACKERWRLRRLRVFTVALWRDVRIVAGGLFFRCLVHLETRLTFPFALQLVLDVAGEPAEALGLDFDFVAVHKRIETAMVCAGGDDVARLQRMDRGQP